MALALSRLVVLVTLAPASALSLFLRTTWLGELPESTWRAWFELMKRGRHEGPSSPFYMESLALQNTACCENSNRSLGCLGPKCSELGLPANALLVKELDALSEYFPLFDRVWVGTSTAYGFDVANASAVAQEAKLQADIGRQFLDRYGALAGVEYGWYITREARLSAATANPRERAGWNNFLSRSMEALHGVEPRFDFLWSPDAGGEHLNATARAAEEAGLAEIICGLAVDGVDGERSARPLPHPLALHFQDWLGQSVSFTFPYHYNYSSAFTCEDDTVPNYKMLTRVAARCPEVLREVKVNAELFAERLSRDGQRGEDNGALIVRGGHFDSGRRARQTYGLTRVRSTRTRERSPAGCSAMRSTRCPSARAGRRITGTIFGATQTQRSISLTDEPELPGLSVLWMRDLKSGMADCGVASMVQPGRSIGSRLGVRVALCWRLPDITVMFRSPRVASSNVSCRRDVPKVKTSRRRHGRRGRGGAW